MDRAEGLFGALQTKISGEDYDGVVEIADQSSSLLLSFLHQVLAVVPGNLDAVKCKVVALIQSSKFTEAVDAVKSYGQLIPEVDASIAP